MKYALSKGASTLVPPGNFESYSFMLDHLEQVMSPLTDAEWALLRAEAEDVKAHPIFLSPSNLIHADAQPGNVG